MGLSAPGYQVADRGAYLVVRHVQILVMKTGRVHHNFRIRGYSYGCGRESPTVEFIAASAFNRMNARL